MIFRTKYKAGDIVLFYNKKICDNDIGQIKKVLIGFSYISGKEEEYDVEPIKIERSYHSYMVRIDKRDIREKLNKKVFKKAFTEKCVKHLTHQHESKGE